MLEKDLESLRQALAPPVLDGLEAGIWLKVAADQEAIRLRRIVLTCQASVVAMVIAGGIALSGVAPREAAAAQSFDAFTLRNLPAPSTLLLGSHS